MGTGQSHPKITPKDKAILDLLNQRDKLKQYQKKIQGVLDREVQLAREALAANKKDKALISLRRKKYQEQLLVQTDNQLATLQNLVSSIEFALIEKDVLFGLSQGNQVLKELNKEMSLEKVEKLMEETAEGIAYQKEVSDLLSTRITSEDEEAVQAELAALEAEALKDSLPTVPVAVVPLPDRTFDDRINALDHEPVEEVTEEEYQAQEREGRALVAA